MVEGDLISRIGECRHVGFSKSVGGISAAQVCRYFLINMQVYV